MSKRQRQVLALGTVAAVLVPALSVRQPRPPSYIGSIIETAPGHYTQEIHTAWMPMWPLYVSLGVAAMTGAGVYKCRTAGAA